LFEHEEKEGTEGLMFEPRMDANGPAFARGYGKAGANCLTADCAESADFQRRDESSLLKTTMAELDAAIC